MENNKQLTFSDIEFRHLVFALPGENIENSFRIVFPIIHGESDSVEANLKFFIRYRTDIPEGNVAVFVHDSLKNCYTYYKTIKHRRKSFALLSDSE